MRVPEGHGPFITYQQILSHDDPPTGRCGCPPFPNHYRADSIDERRQVTCKACGNHWWEECGREVPGPPFEPYTSTLALIEPEKYGLIEAKRRARTRPHPAGRVPRFDWWLDGYLNPLCSDALNPGTINPLDMGRVSTLHRRELARFCFENGNPEAIFDCVADDHEAYVEAAWIGEVRAGWGQDGSPDALSRLHRLRRAHESKKVRPARRPKGVPWRLVMKDVQQFLVMHDFDSPKIYARVVHAGIKVRSDGFMIWAAYSTFLNKFSTQCGGDQQACEFLRLLIAPRPSVVPPV